MSLRVLFAGGGTGGHVFPAIALDDELKRREPGARVRFVGTPLGLESQAVPRAGYELRFIPAQGVKGKGALGQVFYLSQLLTQSLYHSLGIVRDFKPQVVVGTGGYVSGPVVLAAVLQGIPTLIQEQNSYPGLTTRLLAPWVDQVHLGFPSAIRYFRRRDNLRVSGNPTRAGLAAVDGPRARERFGLDRDRLTILVLGGSQGAHSINRAMLEALGELKAGSGVQILWQTGDKDYEWIKEGSISCGPRVVVERFIHDMAWAYGAADLVICRAGAITIAELTRCGLPAILVPYPFAAADHQLFNARTLVEAGAAKMVLDHELNGKRLSLILNDLLAAPQQLVAMARKSKGLGQPGATGRITEAILELARR